MWTYQVNNTTDSNNNHYYVVDKAIHSETDDASGHVWQCQDTTYDEGAASGVTIPGAGWPTTQQNYTTCGTSSTALTSYTAYDQYGNTIATVDALGAANPGLYSSHGFLLLLPSSSSACSDHLHKLFYTLHAGGLQLWPGGERLQWSGTGVLSTRGCFKLWARPSVV